jgi:hypothetical protein
LIGKEAEEAGIVNLGLRDRECQQFDASATLTLYRQSVKR